jgi:hypothetical protein
MRPDPRPLLASALIALAATGAAGCGSDDGEDTSSAARPAPPASQFPAVQDRTLEQVLGVATSEGPVVTPAARVLRVGENRFVFGVFTVEREQIDDAEVAIYAAPGGDLNGRATGPFPARIEDLSTEDAFRARSTADDPDAATVAYVSEIPLDRPGRWSFGALLREGDSYAASLLAAPSLAGEFDVPASGERAPRVSTPTVDDVAEVSEIDTRVPPSTMHDEDLADVLGREPAVLLFATPALCQSRVCGPVVDVAEQVKRDYGDRVAFIHQEVYEDNDLNKGVRPQMKAYRLPSEPWLFVIDREGVISTAIEGPFSAAELEAAVERVAGPA